MGGGYSRNVGYCSMKRGSDYAGEHFASLQENFHMLHQEFLLFLEGKGIYETDQRKVA